MKKIFFLFMLIIAAPQLKAQSLQTQTFNNLLIHSIGKLPDDYFSKKYFNKPTDSLKTTNHSQQLLADAEKEKRFLNQYVYDRMPIAKLNGYSKMPVIQLYINSKMPVINPDDANRVLQLKKP
jgi:hypothetical protein